MLDPNATDFAAWRQLAITPFAAVPTFEPSAGGAVATFSPSYECPRCGRMLSIASGALESACASCPTRWRSR